MNTRKLHQALRRTLVPTWCLAACLAWGDSPTLAPVEKKLLSALVSTSEDEKLRAIDALVNRQCTSLEVRSALRRTSIQDTSPEVRGAARFALVKLQALAPPTQTAGPQNVVAAIVPDETQRLRDLKLKETIEEVNDSAADKEIAQAGAVSTKSNSRGIQHAIPQPSDVTVDNASKVVRITTINSSPAGPVQVAGSSNSQTDTTQAPSPRNQPDSTEPSKSTGAAIASVEANPVWHSAMKPSEAAMRAGAEKASLPTIAQSEGPTTVTNEVPVPVAEPSTPKEPSKVPNPVPVPSITLAPAEPPKVPINTPVPEAPPAEVASVPAVTPSISPALPANTPPVASQPIAPPAVAPSLPAMAEAPAVTAPAPVAATVPEGTPAPAVAETVPKSEPTAPSTPPAVLDQLPAVGVGTSKAPLAPPAVANVEKATDETSPPGAETSSLPKAEVVTTDRSKPDEVKAEKITAFAGKKIPRTESHASSTTTQGGMTEFPPVRTPSALAESMGQGDSRETKSASATKLPPAAPASVPNEKPAWGVPSPSVATNRGFGKPESTTAELEKAPLIPIESIPRDEEGRKKMAKELLDKGRKFVEAGQIAEAESVLYQVREFAIRYGRFQYSPESLEKDIIKARQRLRAQAAAAAEKTT